ncbi:hypothetical protein PISMIDRAFT_676731 [Pisolithus microcarpus 441]|uniref:Uncharacterized protein n=1 Tax=Pisolithus microcarpus 441 TaxID=765257 RepID=A0A0C9Z921_9AGAM|nr:hypothetical protein PISMIDRAFT_676731 [Pisolithus microcarpus 441]
MLSFSKVQPDHAGTSKTFSGAFCISQLCSDDGTAPTSLRATRCKRGSWLSDVRLVQFNSSAYE